MKTLKLLFAVAAATMTFTALAAKTGWNYFQSLGPEWQICGIGDLNGDGRDDLRIRTANGDLGAELVKGEDSLTWAYYGSVGEEWLTEPLGIKLERRSCFWASTQKRKRHMELRNGIKWFMGALVASVSFGLFAGTATGVYVNGESVGDNTSGTGWKLSDGYIQLTASDKSYTITGTDSTKKLGVRVKAANCTVKAVNLNLDPSREGQRGAFVLDKDVSELVCRFQFQGNCSFQSGETFAGIEVPSNAKIIITNLGSSDFLSASGGKYGAGIGGANNTRHPGDIIIQCNSNGHISAFGNYGAGIGGGMKYESNRYYGGDCLKAIVISGGVIEAYGTYGSAGIGGGDQLVNTSSGTVSYYGGVCTDIRISGGVISAYGSSLKYYGGASIGSGESAKYSRGIKISGGTVNAGTTSTMGDPSKAIGSSYSADEEENVMIIGGSINCLGNCRMTDKLVNDVGETVQKVTIKHYLANDGAALSDILRTRGVGDIQTINYGTTDLQAGANGEVNLYLPYGIYLFTAAGRTCDVTVNKAGGVVVSMKLAKAVLANSRQTLRFVYDDKDVYGVMNKDWFAVDVAEAGAPTANPPWTATCRGTVKYAVFDASFKKYYPKHCGRWFFDFKFLTEVNGLENLTVSSAGSLYGLFGQCSSLELLDLKGFSTSSVTDMSMMFYQCSQLKTILASEKFVTTKVSVSSSMFTGCLSLVGGAGTAYDSTKTDKAYARIDKAGAPGYFTDIADVYKVKFVAGEGTGTMADLICARDKVYNLTKCAFTAPTGKAFKGWAGSNDRRYDDGVLVFNAAAEGATLTLTAIWE